MYSDKINIGILTALLKEHDVRQAVVCPGSRNAAIVNNLVACPEVECHAATDERSAGFEAMGMSMATGRPTVVCVTSGSALLNVMPAVAEAWHQHVPLVVVSADRPKAWIEQLDGQTLDQPGAMSRWCCMSVNIGEAKDEEERWNCNWMVNKALLTAKKRKRPVHINVPLSEPLYNFACRELPVERVVRERSVEEMVRRFAECERVMIVAGQNRELPLMEELSRRALVYAEPLAWCGVWSPADYMIENVEEPEMVIYLGGTIVSKKVKETLRHARNAEQWYVSENGEVADTFMNLGNVVFDSNIYNVSERLAAAGKERRYAIEWRKGQEGTVVNGTEEEKVVAALEKMVSKMDCNVCYANSMAVRYACRHARHNIFCNRGVNGIEGSVSTAVGVARGSKKMCVCVTGDLSFLYDSNALWRRDLPGNLRIVVLNNGGGKIFERFEALEGNEAKPFVTGRHEASCEGVCKSFGIEYRQATEHEKSLEWLISGNGTKLLEFII